MSEPAYLALAEELAALVRTLGPGDRVPSENDLIAANQVSRLTARAALQELESRFLVRRVRGAGTFVAHRIALQLAPEAPISVRAAVSDAGAVPATTFLSTRTRRPSAAVRDALDLDGDERVVTITRADTVDGLPAAYATSHLPVEVADGIVDHLDEQASLDATLRAAFGLDPRRLWARAELVVAPAEVAAELGVEGRPLVWRLESCTHDARLGRPVELSQRWLRADVFHVVFELGRAG